MKKVIETISVVLILGAVIFSGAFLIYTKTFNQTILPPIENKVALRPENEKIILPTEVMAPEFIKPKPEVTLMAVGDIMLSRSVEQLMVKKNDFTLPFVKLANVTKGVDIAFGNLETTVIAGRKISTGEFEFRTDPKSLEGLKLAGFDLVSLANNHTYNFGAKGLDSTFVELQKADIKYVGAGEGSAEAAAPVIIERGGMMFGFLSYVYPQPQSSRATADRPGLNFMDLDQLKNDVNILKDQVDWVVVTMHSGTEYKFKPNQEQINFAHAAIDAGASVVIGHHPHVVQTFEKYKDGYIFYSLGNFVFDQMWSEETKQGLMAKIVFNSDQIQSIQAIPIIINQEYQPDIATAPTDEKIVSRLSYDFKIQPQFIWRDGSYVERPRFEINNSVPTFKKFEHQVADIDGDGQVEELAVIDQAAYLFKNNKLLWQSDASLEVDNVITGDINNDQKPEVIISLWKEGSFGPDQPFWVEDNDHQVRNHLFIYQWQGDTLKLIWGSSALDQPIKEMALTNLNQNGQNELAVLEGFYDKFDLTSDFSIWRWNEWNMVNDYKSRVGKFFDLRVDLDYIDIKEEK